MSMDPAASLHLQVDEVERRMREATQRLDKVTQVHEALADIVGTAETADGHVRVTYNGQGVDELTINPRAMRLTSADLGDEIKKALDEAAADFRTKVTTAMQEQGAMPSPADVEQGRAEARRDFERAQRDFNAALRTAATDIDRAAQLRRDAGPN